LGGVIKNKILQFQDLWQSKGIICNTELNKTAIRSNKELVDILLDNLFGNATRHNINNGFINITLQNNFFELSNTGINQPLDSSMVFKRFYKGKPTGQSNGLGLSIVKEICDVSSIHINYSYQDEWHHFRLTW
jgi:signal transduction histidine kinase